jgi:hypothetical protein
MRAIPWPEAETGGDLPLTQGNSRNFVGVTGVGVTGVFMRDRKSPFVPAEAGTQEPRILTPQSLGPRFRGDERRRAVTGLVENRVLAH